MPKSSSSQAVKRAMEERGVKVNVVPEYEMVGVSRRMMRSRSGRSAGRYTSEQGYMEAATGSTNFPIPTRSRRG